MLSRCVSSVLPWIEAYTTTWASRKLIRRWRPDSMAKRPSDTLVDATASVVKIAVRRSDRRPTT